MDDTVGRATPSDEPGEPSQAKASSQPKGATKTPSDIVPNPLIDGLIRDHLRLGVLIPLKTTQEVRQDHTVVQAWITRAPTKQANDVIKCVPLC